MSFGLHLLVVIYKAQQTINHQWIYGSEIEMQQSIEKLLRLGKGGETSGQLLLKARDYLHLESPTEVLRKKS